MKKLFRLLTLTDIVLLVLLIFAAAASVFLIKSIRSSCFVEIYHHQNFIGNFDLKVDQIIELEDEAIVEIAAGKVRMKHSTCSRQYCVQQGWSDQMPIFCVPNEISIVIISKKQEMLITR